MPKISEFYVYIIEAAPGNETVPSLIDETRGVIHMATDRADIASNLKPRAIEVAKETGYPLKLVKFTNMEVIEVFAERH